MHKIYSKHSIYILSSHYKSAPFGNNTIEIMIEDTCQNSKQIHGIRSPQNQYTMI